MDVMGSRATNPMAAAVPVPAKIDTTGVDDSHDLSPTSPVDRQRMEHMMANRPGADELQNKNILKGHPTDALAAKRSDLERSMRTNRLHRDIENRPSADELVKKGVLHADQLSPHQ
ncbi:uncharacterized protein CcaverHIS019_0401910 [Cutaneotrichosporon cavernicola]|uniref:RPEL repeat protein n=1 Tax=Cutaneotrichosporon cavernicola TaxID=279322 RepID=A0AA48L3M6_9TREE|nr:uncharacterized protein CcaverHIS019_0401910 [Cutaneotrichosporon cavernicola]BEI91371.1 hypothetical protein CcaverHIS019_0401910 [Cutaneotrichosporon cavernicola]BEI99144.1 hypothetical protein CcaverHIS631_0401870 [Cutaneotrichosporon cavernicola]